MKDHYALCLGTFSPGKAEEIKRLIYQGGKSRTAMIVFRGRSPNESAPKKGKNPYQYSLPKRYANKLALYVRPRPKVEALVRLAEKVNRFSDGNSSGIKDVTKIIRDLKKLGYSKSKIVKTLGIQESEVK